MDLFRGSTWSKWDLHVHTPLSIVEHFSGTNEEEIWENYITDLENLPSEIKVLGINDYIFIDGYRKVKHFKDSGRLANIDLLLPVVELRLDKFGGTRNQLSRVNFHVIFSNELGADIIETYFLNALKSKYELSSEATSNSVEWNSIITKESLAQLGRKIKETVPQEELSYYGSDLLEGFNNLNLNQKEIMNVLEQHHFSGKYLTAVGKTEWADIKWNDNTIADKKNTINKVDIVFVSSYNATDYTKAVESLRKARVNSKLLDCSDAHYNSNSLEKDRLGNCATWLKADPTFCGLKQVLNEWEERVFIGDSPPKLLSVQNNPGKYIKSISINSKNRLNGWFDNVHVQLNSDLVAIIGNKGNGKSALADIIGLAGGTKNANEFSFLTKGRFRNGNLAKNFDAIIEWENGVKEDISLDENPKEHNIEKVKYLPQRYLETLCNVEDEKFENELKKVIFSHVDEKDKYQKSSLNELIQYKGETIQDSIRIFTEQLYQINDNLLKLETKATPNYLSSVQELLKNEMQKLDAHVKQKPEEVPPPNSSSTLSAELIQVSNIIDISKKELLIIVSEIEAKKAEQLEIKNKLALIQRMEEKINNFKLQYSMFLSNCIDEVSKLELDISKIIAFTVDVSTLRSMQDELSIKDRVLALELSETEPESLIKKKETLELIIKFNQSKLDEPSQRYHLYKKSLAEWELKQIEIMAEVERLNQYVKFIKDEIPKEISKQKLLRKETTKEIFGEILKISEIYSSLYKPVQRFIDKHSLTDSEFELKFEVSIDGSSVEDGILGKINQVVSGKFRGAEEGKRIINTYIDEADFNNVDSTMQFIDKIMNSLINDSSQPDSSNIGVQLKKNITVLEFYQYLFSLDYLKPFYSLKLGEKEITKLSPGEKGALLLIFYLLVDNDDIPLIIDQPEENLDNQSVFKMLVPCIKEAKKRRQIIMVTHNPNLAVVCDAEQIVHAQMDKINNNNISYITGSIENSRINKSIIDILEGTKPAFSNRQAKYSLF